MSRPVVLGTALVASACAACNDRTPAADPPPASSTTSSPARPAGPITLLDPSGSIAAALALDGATCTATLRGAAITVARAGDADTITGAAITIERTPAGDQLSRDGARVARVWRDPARPGHTDVVDPAGMALLRVDATTAGATLSDAAGAVTARVVFEGGRFVSRDASDAALAYVTGGDAATAALLTSSLPLDLRAIAACDRLLAPVSP